MGPGDYLVMVSPKTANHASIVKRIVVAAVYYKPGSKKKSLLLDLLKNIKNTRNHNKYKVNFAKNDRYKKSTIPTLQRMPNDHEKERNLATSYSVCTSELCHTAFCMSHH